MRRPDIATKIRGLVWVAPVLAAWQAGCSTMHSSCEDFQSERQETRVPRSVADAGSADGGVQDPLASDEACQVFCQQNVGAFGTPYTCRAETDDGGTIIVCAFNTVCEGRRPEGFRVPAANLEAPLLGRYFAAMASGEAASGMAFERLAEELAALDLPGRLIRRARYAARQEARHFRMTAALARHFGVEAKGPELPARSRRSLSSLARENAREGVVRETFGAVAGWWQARHATERCVRRIMRQIAGDETSHAELSWAIDAALRNEMSSSERAELDANTRDAIACMRRELEAEVDAELVTRAGLPNRSVTRALFEAAQRELWS